MPPEAASPSRRPGLVETKEAYGETTLVVDPARLVEACLYLRDELGFDFLSDITPTDYLGWGRERRRRLLRHRRGPRHQRTRLAGPVPTLPKPKPKRFAMNYHLLSVSAEGASRVRLQVWLDDGEPVPSVIDVWPTADWHEREAWDMMGIPVSGHPNLVRILMDDDWEGHPLRKDYPLGGEPVRFSGEE